MYEKGTSVLIGDTYKGVIVDTLVIYKPITRSYIVKYKIEVIKNNRTMYFWLTDTFFVHMNEVKKSKIKLFLLSIWSKILFLKLRVEFQEITVNK